MFLTENAAKNQVYVFVSGFGARGKIIENGMPCGELLRRLEEVHAVYGICNKPDFRRDMRGFSVFVSGDIACENKMGESDLVCNIMQQWLVQHRISERCIYVDRVSPNIETSVGVFWKHLQSANIDNRTTVCVVSQTYHAIYLQQLLDFISQGKCLSMIRCCQYGSVRSMFSDMFQALFQYCSELVERRHFHQGKLKVAGGRTSL